MSADDEKLTAHHWKLFGFLGVATFFEGYDHIALTQILPNFREAMGVGPAEGGLLVTVINVGTILAYFLVRKADQWGRRRVLTVTIAGYTIFSFLTGLSPNVWVFALCQLVARVFLIGEWATSMVYAAEEFPAGKRGMMIGLITAFASLGSVACAGLVPILLRTEWGWRTVYFAGTLPLLLLAFARRSLRESQRFERLSGSEKSGSIFRIWRTPYRTRVIQLALIWLLTYLCTATALTFWKEHAIAPPPASGPHLSDGEVGLFISVAAVLSMPMVFGVGKLLDWLGRRRGAVVIFVVTAVSCASAYLVESKPLLFVAVVGSIFGISAVLPVLNAYTTELFPTHLRGDAFAWSNNLLGRLGYVLAPAVVGASADSFGWGPSVAATAIGPIIALALILTWLPETRGLTLEQTSTLEQEPERS